LSKFFAKNFTNDCHIFVKRLTTLINRETGVDGVLSEILQAITGRMQENHRNGQEESDVVETIAHLVLHRVKTD